MRVLVTGGSGQVGSELAGHLPGHEVVTPGRTELDLADRDSVEQMVARVAPDLVVNCAAYTAVDQAEAEPGQAMLVNAVGVRHLAVACRRIDAHLVHVSTDYVFDGDKQAPYDEYDLPAPRSAYGRSKWAGELEVMRHAGSWTIARSAWVFGRVGRSFVETIVRRARAGEPLRVVDDQWGSPTFAPHLAGMLARLGVERRQGVFHVVNAGSCSWFQLAADVLAVAGVEADLQPMTTPELRRPAPRPANSVLTSLVLPSLGGPPLPHYREALGALVAGEVSG